MYPELRHSVIRQMFSPENTWSAEEPRAHSGGAWNFISHIATAFLNLFHRPAAMRRVSPRARLRAVCELVLDGGTVVRGVITDVGPRGLSMEVHSGEFIPAEVVVRMEPGSAPVISVKGEVAWQEVKKTKKALGIRFSDTKAGRVFWEAARLF